METVTLSPALVVEAVGDIEALREDQLTCLCRPGAGLLRELAVAPERTLQLEAQRQRLLLLVQPEVL